MKDTLIIAVDLGTSFIKASAFGTEGTCVAEATEPVKDYRPSPGVFIQKGAELFDSVLSCMREVCGELDERAGSVEAIVFSGQMAGFMGVSESWEDITTWSCSLDSRYMPYARRQMAELRDVFLSVSGTNFPQMAPKYEWFKKEFPTDNKKIVKYLMISGYVIGRLGGLDIESAVIDRSYISWTGLADVNGDKWSGEICGAIGLEQKYLPRIVDCNTICGKLSAAMAKAVGLPSGIPLVAGAGDKVAGCLGAGSVEPGRMVFEAGSYGQISICVSEYRPDMRERRLDALCSAIPGQYHMVHFAAGSGITLDWFVNNFVAHPGESRKDAFARIERLAEEVPAGSEGVFALGLLSGSSMPSDPILRGLFLGHDWSHRPEHFYRALLESYAYDFALPMARAGLLYPELALDEVRAIGGGAKSRNWMQINADVSGKAFSPLRRKDVSLWGAVLLAGNAIGLFPDLKAAAEAGAQTVSTFRPESEAAALYQNHLAVYRDYLVSTRDIFGKLQSIG